MLIAISTGELLWEPIGKNDSSTGIERLGELRSSLDAYCSPWVTYILMNDFIKGYQEVSFEGSLFMRNSLKSLCLG